MSDLNFKLATACAGCYAGATPQWEDALKTVHVYLSEVDGVHTFAFEGTTDWQEWIIDFMALEVPVMGYPFLGPVHLGLMRDVLAVEPRIYQYLRVNGWPPYYVTGHSKGAGEAILFTALMKQQGHPPLACRAFEPPQVGGHVLRDYLSDVDVQWTCTVNGHGRDIVTRVPFGPTWSHVNDPVLLTVPDDYDIGTQHRIPAVIAALSALLPADAVPTQP